MELKPPDRLEDGIQRHTLDFIALELGIGLNVRPHLEKQIQEDEEKERKDKLNNLNSTAILTNL